MAASPETIIDFHVHLFPDRLFDAIWRHFADDYGWDVIYHFYYRECIAHLRENGVGAVAYSNYAHKQGMARSLNDWNLQVLDEIPDVYCFAAYHPEDKDGPDMAESLVGHPRILGFKLQLLVQRFYPHNERLYPLYDLIMKAGKRLLIHTGTGPIGNEFTGISHFKKLLRRYPDMKITIPHMGALEYDEFGKLLDDYPNLYFDTAYTFIPQMAEGFLTSGLGIEFLEKYQDRILYGSDFPNVLYPREVEIQALLDLNLSQSFYDKVFRNNAIDIIADTTISNG